MLPGISSSTLRTMAYQAPRPLVRVTPAARSGAGSDGSAGSGHPGADTAAIGGGHGAHPRADADARPAFDFADAHRPDGPQDQTAHMLSRHNAYVAGQRATRGGKGRMSAYESVMNMTA
ncbi:MAG TPA: hypothetical protein VF649_05405 [Sphingomonas sp.]|jgi:hypothetical protein|uniref:hypothetical protein n=1 Tax=Sphingomonas sp. TaxID=28214 RepID=UPI002ED796B7